MMWLSGSYGAFSVYALAIRTLLHLQSVSGFTKPEAQVFTLNWTQPPQHLEATLFILCCSSECITLNFREGFPASVTELSRTCRRLNPSTCQFMKPSVCMLWRSRSCKVFSLCGVESKMYNRIHSACPNHQL